ncbi:hypothetical protein N7478_007110 [Penicillium angulare]|uniref:uncharacterized protein n=1 Tax=Penicillium angulare TaxID=116970 RepID=UPI002541164A|nr:uncharacterized protein N7478_007110 [Penicillium angulare]KAJ5281738.1 hypothetical protein N7478_007110 [Penicillium angulare]
MCRVFDENITADWSDEIAQSCQDLRRSMMDWIYRELQRKAETLKENGFVLSFDVGVVNSIQR